MKKTNFKILIIGLGLITLTACKPPAKDGARTYTTNGNTNVTSTTNTTIPQCANFNAATGNIFDAQNNTQYEQRVKDFLSATVNPQEIGTISPQYQDNTGVWFSGVIKLNRQNGQVTLNQSKISIVVYDSYAITGQAQYIPVTINAATSGQFDLQTGVGAVTFKDNYGEIKLDGKIEAQQFTGTISFVNTVTVVAGGTPARGTLGNFSIVTCGMIQ